MKEAARCLRLDDAAAEYRFDGYRLEVPSRRLLAPDGAVVPLTPRVFDTLLLLVQHPGELLGKDDMLAALWPDRVVEENNLAQAVSTLRHALGDRRRDPTHVMTVPGRGYRFVARLDEVPVEGGAGRTSSGTGSDEAHRLYLTGRHHMDKARPDEFAIAIAHFRRAIDLDPVYALAWAAMGEAYRRLPLAGDAVPREAFPLAQAAAQKALAIEPALALAHATLGWVAFWHAWDWAAAEAHFRHAIALAPDVAEAHLGLAHLFTNLGRFEDALAPAETALRLDPFSPIIATITASFVGAAGRTEEARTRLDRVIDAAPDFWVALLHRAELALAGGDEAAALPDLLAARDKSAGRLQVLGPLGYVLARSGRAAEARTLVDELDARAGHGFVPPTSIAMILAGLGETGRALDQLQRAYTLRDVRLTFLGRDTAWRDLRNHPRFIALAQSLALG